MNTPSVSQQRVTELLAEWSHGDNAALAELTPLVYDELRKLAAQKMAQEAPGQTLQPTGLVHEAYLRLVDVETAQRWESRGHFFAAAAEAMRRMATAAAAKKCPRLFHCGAVWAPTSRRYASWTRPVA